MDQKTNRAADELLQELAGETDLLSRSRWSRTEDGEVITVDAVEVLAVHEEVVVDGE